VQRVNARKYLGTPVERAARAGCHLSTLYRWEHRLATTGSVQRSPAADGHDCKLSPDAHYAILWYLTYRPTACGAEVRDFVLAAVGEMVGAPHLPIFTREFHKLDLTHKRAKGFPLGRPELPRVHFCCNCWDAGDPDLSSPEVHGERGVAGNETAAMDCNRHWCAHHALASTASLLLGF